MHFLEQTQQGVPVLGIFGEIDLTQAPKLRMLLDGKAQAKCPVLILDITEVTFIDSSGLSVLSGYQRTVSEFGGMLLFAGARPEVRELFQVLCLDQFFRLFDSVDTAHAAVRSGPYLTDHPSPVLPTIPSESRPVAEDPGSGSGYRKTESPL